MSDEWINCRLAIADCRWNDRDRQSPIGCRLSAIGYSLLAAAAILILTLMAPRAWGQETALTDDECLKCHGKESIAGMRPQALAAMVRIPAGQKPIERTSEEIARLYLSKEKMAASAHGQVACVSCHTGIEKLPHDETLTPIACQDCHAEAAKAVAAGPHGSSPSSGRRLPACSDCHGPTHEIRPIEQPRTFHEAESIVAACAQCHDEPDAQGLNPVQTYRENVHGDALFDKGLPFSATCVDCHGYHEVLPPTDPASPINPRKAPATCGRCHQGIEEVYFASVHGKNLLEGQAQAASCPSCHGSHGIGKVDQPFLLSVVRECSTCHLELGKSYLASYHGKATTLGYGSAAVCASCHGAHDILPPSDPASRVAPGNLQTTCGQCHQKVNRNFVKYIAHAEMTNRKKNPQVFYTWLAMTILLVSVLAVFIPHTILWFQRSLPSRLRNLRGHVGAPERERMVLRFPLIHRVTHFLVVVSFMGLVATGFPLKYSYAGWAREMAGLLGGIPTMRFIHRALALVTFIYAGLHVGFLIVFFHKHCPRPRRRFLFGPNSMIFSWKDFKDIAAMLRWFLWLGPRPRFDRWTYYEKFDYWGEIWGVLLIGGTGIILWAPTFFTRWLPGWVLNCAMVIHSIEALIAASIIFLAHFFNTHLRPEKLPLDMVMFTGQMPESEMQHERPLEYERLVATGALDQAIVDPVPLRWRVVGAIGGLAALLCGITLIVLAIKTELGQFIR
ncbi:MAG: hypothetical protein NTW86_21615 [Candidatus Sumerlaeota bacterium]|nr:hypothetical protein [Candidatus Sumerlaeota bacterium]